MVEEHVLPLEDLEKKIGLCFIDKGLLRAAFTSRSYSKEVKDKDSNVIILDNERLEFLGDAVIELVVREHIANQSFNICIIMWIDRFHEIPNISLFFFV